MDSVVIKKSKLKKKKKQTKAQNRRYKLHSKIKGLFELYPKQNLVVIPFDCDLKDSFVIELRDKFNYSIQYSIISPNQIEVIEPIIVIN
jgi:hypothetical protein